MEVNPAGLEGAVARAASPPGGERSSGAIYTPRQVASLLGVPASTLRSYAVEFSDLLSAAARGTTGGTGSYRHRRYTAADVALLERAKVLLAAGLSYRAVAAQLAAEGPRRTPGLVAPARRPRRPPRDQATQPREDSPSPPGAPAAPRRAVADLVPERDVVARLAEIGDDLTAIEATLARLELRLDRLADDAGKVIAILEKVVATVEQGREEQAAPAAEPPAGGPSWLSRLGRRASNLFTLHS